MGNIVLYTIGCPNCIVLEKMLKSKNINFETVTDMDIIQSKNIMFAPALEVNGDILNYVKASEWVKNYTRKDDANEE